MTLVNAVFALSAGFLARLLALLVSQFYLRQRGQLQSEGWPSFRMVTSMALIGGGLGRVLAWRYGVGTIFLAHMAMVTWLLILARIDLAILELPDVFTLSGTVLVIPLAIFVLGMDFSDILLGAVIGGGGLFLLREAYKPDGRYVLGLGDVKLMVMLGAFGGWQSLYAILGISSLLALVYAWQTRIWTGKGTRKREGLVPFGPFLASGWVCYALF